MIKSAFLGVLLFLAFARLGVAAPPAKVAYKISGVAISTRDGAPIPYCRMQLTETVNVPAGPRTPGRRGRQDPPEVDADVRGHFQFTLEHPGTYVLTGSAREYRRQNFDEHDGFFSSIVLTAAEPTAQVTFRMERDAAIMGLVLDEAGEPVRNAQVAAELPGQLENRPGRGGGAAGGRGVGGVPGRQAGFSQTDDRGRYELTGLAPGAYRVHVTARPWYAQSTTISRTSTSTPSLDPSLDLVYPVMWYPGVADDAAAESIRLTSGEERQADFHLSPTTAVNLIVPRAEPPAQVAGEQIRPQRGATLVRISPGGTFSQSISTNSNSQEFSGLIPGLYEIRTAGPDGRPESQARQFQILPGSSGVVDLSSATVLTKVTLVFDGVEANEAGQISFVDAVTGRTVNPDGGFGNFGGRRRDTDANREHAVYLAPGKWEVHLPNFAATYLQSLQATGAEIAGATLTVGSQPVSLTLHMGTGRAEISGVASAAGKPVQGAMILLVPATLGDPGSVTDVQRDQTNTDGSFTLAGVVPGKYILLAIDHGWDVKWRDLATLEKYLTKGVPVEVKANDKVKRDVEVSPR